MVKTRPVVKVPGIGEFIGFSSFLLGGERRIRRSTSLLGRWTTCSYINIYSTICICVCIDVSLEVPMVGWINKLVYKSFSLISSNYYSIVVSSICKVSEILGQKFFRSETSSLSVGIWTHCKCTGLDFSRA